MAVVSVTDFALHLQKYLDQAVRGETITIRLQNNHLLALVLESSDNPSKKTYTKADLLERLTYQGGQMDSQQIDQLLY